MPTLQADGKPTLDHFLSGKLLGMLGDREGMKKGSSDHEIEVAPPVFKIENPTQERGPG